MPKSTPEIEPLSSYASVTKKKKKKKNEGRANFCLTCLRWFLVKFLGLLERETAE